MSTSAGASASMNAPGPSTSGGTSGLNGAVSSAAASTTAAAAAAQQGKSTSPNFARRVRRGQKIEDALAPPTELPSSVHSIDSSFQLQEYLSLLLRLDPHDVERIVRIPEADASRVLAGESPRLVGAGIDNGPAGAEGSSSGGAAIDTEADAGLGAAGAEEEIHPVDTDVWVYEQLRRIVQDLSTPWLSSLQHECSRQKHPSTCDAMNAGDWMYLCASHGEEKQCCAIDYIVHTLDGTAALLNSPRHFPVRTYIPTTSLRHFGSISRRLSRIFVHAKDHHRDVFDQCESETSLYARFYALCKMYDLIAVETLPPPPPSPSSSSAASSSASASETGRAGASARDADADVDDAESFARSTPASASASTASNGSRSPAIAKGGADGASGGEVKRMILLRRPGGDDKDEDGQPKRTDTTVHRTARDSAGGKTSSAGADTADDAAPASSSKAEEDAVEAIGEAL